MSERSLVEFHDLNRLNFIRKKDLPNLTISHRSLEEVLNSTKNSPKTKISKNTLIMSSNVVPVFKLNTIPMNNISVSNQNTYRNPRRDVNGVEIKKGNKSHKINFKQPLAEVIPVENFKELYYTMNNLIPEKTKKASFCCSDSGCLLF